jgi:hypothetical protein
MAALTLPEDEMVLFRIREPALGDPVEVTLAKVGDVRWVAAKAFTVAFDVGEKDGERRSER